MHTLYILIIIVLIKFKFDRFERLPFQQELFSESACDYAEYGRTTISHGPGCLLVAINKTHYLENIVPIYIIIGLHVHVRESATFDPVAIWAYFCASLYCDSRCYHPVK